MEYDFSKESLLFLKSLDKRFSKANNDEEEKEYDHEMTISEEQMNELHEKGVTYVTETDNGQTMVIKVEYYRNNEEEE